MYKLYSITHNVYRVIYRNFPTSELEHASPKVRNLKFWPKWHRQIIFARSLSGGKVFLFHYLIIICNTSKSIPDYDEKFKASFKEMVRKFAPFVKNGIYTPICRAEDLHRLAIIIPAVSTMHSDPRILSDDNQKG